MHVKRGYRMVNKPVRRTELDNTLSGLPDRLFRHIYSPDRLLLIVLSHDDGELLLHHYSESEKLYADGASCRPTPRASRYIQRISLFRAIARLYQRQFPTLQK